MRTVRLAMAAAAFGAGVMVAAPIPSSVNADEGDVEITDERLLSDLAELSSRRVQSASESSVTVEVLTTDNAGISAAINRLGGNVTGGVAGQVVQAKVPVSKLKVLANTRGATFVRAPRAAGYIPGDTRIPSLHRAAAPPARRSASPTPPRGTRLVSAVRASASE